MPLYGIKLRNNCFSIFLCVRSEIGICSERPDNMGGIPII